jgi:hypothetical protein
MRKVVPWVAALGVLVALLPAVCVSAEGGPTRCRSLALVPLPWGEHADTWGYVVAFAAMLATFLALRLLLGRTR